jgi:hypothetical protein
MNAKRFALAIALTLAATVAAKSQGSAGLFVEAKSLPPHPFEPDHFEFSIRSETYRISNRGKGSVKIDSSTRSFDLRLLRYDRLERLYSTEYEQDLLIIGGITDGESGAGFLARLDTKRMKLKWKRAIPAFSVGPGLIHERHGYVTAIGFIGKINLDSGAYAWKHNNLYDDRTGAFNSFELPEISGNTIVFREAPNYLRKKTAVVIVDRASGKILNKDL